MVKVNKKRTLKKESSKKSPIPKKLHFIWLGPKKPPYLTKFMKTFEIYAPGFEVRLWGDKDITNENFPRTYTTIQKVKEYQGKAIKEYTQQKTMYKTNKNVYSYSKYAQISDLMRYEIVFNEGGYYFDANMFLLKDITKLFNRNETFVGCNELGRNMEESEILSNSFFGAIQGSPVLKRLLTPRFLKGLDLRTLDVDFVTGPGALRNALHIESDNYYIFPPNTFYPYILPWTASGEDHHLRKSSEPKCTGPIRTKQRNLKMKKNLWLEFPCQKYKSSYGIKIWESGGSWSRPPKWYEAEGSKMITRYQTGGVAPCIPCAGMVITSGPAGLALGAAGACAYGIQKLYKSKKKSSKKKSSKKKSSKKKSSKKSKP